MAARGSSSSSAIIFFFSLLIVCSYYSNGVSAAGLISIRIVVDLLGGGGKCPVGRLNATTFTFYQHQAVGGTATPTEVVVAGTLNKFGAFSVISNPITASPEPPSSLTSAEVIGFAQGCQVEVDPSAAAAKSRVLVKDILFAFNGNSPFMPFSTLEVAGKADLTQPRRERAITGGTIEFRLAKGVVRATTVDSDAAAGTTVIKNDVTVCKPLSSSA